MAGKIIEGGMTRERSGRRTAMKIVRGKVVAAGFILMTLLMVNLLVTLQTAQAVAGPKEFTQLNAAIALADNLIALQGKTVAVSLSSGQTVMGVVKEVQNNLLYLEKLNQKEFYDALIRVDQIIAIEVKAR
jgi:small nuclear ribonucleoprotein (snRNP)-like protein